MKLRKVKPYPGFFTTCKHCQTRLDSTKHEIFADLDGEPFEDYYCKACKESGFLEQRKDGKKP